MCVATVANIAIALTPRLADATQPSGAGPVVLGLGAPAWSVAMMAVAFSLGVAALLLRGDATFCVPIAWGLLAIASQQRSPDFPGSAGVVTAATGLGATLFALAGAAAAARAALLFSGRTRFATAAEASAADEGAEGGAPRPSGAIAEDIYAALVPQGGGGGGGGGAVKL